MPVALSTISAGGWFKLSNAPLTNFDKYILSKDTGSSMGKLVVVNLGQNQIQELDSTTMVIALSLSFTATPVYSLA